LICENSVFTSLKIAVVALAWQNHLKEQQQTKQSLLSSYHQRMNGMYTII
jgi:hypothetical protein